MLPIPRSDRYEEDSEARGRVQTIEAARIILPLQ